MFEQTEQILIEFQWHVGVLNLGSNLSSLLVLVNKEI